MKFYVAFFLKYVYHGLLRDFVILIVPTFYFMPP